jgi:uncharacterized protein DUF4249
MNIQTLYNKCIIRVTLGINSGLNNGISKILMIAIITAIVLGACTEKIDIDLGTTYTRLTVEGYITPEENEQYVRLTKTSDYFANKPSPAVSGANVIIDDGTSLVEFVEDIARPGYYNAPTNFIGIPGNSYKLNIKLTEDINGSSEYNAEETMPFPAERVDSIALEYNDLWEMWMVKLYAWEPPSTDYYMFNGLVNGELITDTVSSKNISDDRLFNGNYTAGAVVLVINEEDINDGDIFTLVLSNITEEYANFMLDVQTEIQPHDPMFSGPPANVRSNINNDGIGYFSAYPSVYSSTVAKYPAD